MIRKIKKIIKLMVLKRKWREKNEINKTGIVNIFPLDIVKVGRCSYGLLEIYSWGNQEEGLEIGNFVSIAPGVKFILGGNHEINTFTTYPFKVILWGENVEALTKGRIIVKDDVWIGMDAMIMSGVTIGQGAIIAARSVVTKDVPAYAVVGGNPAKIIKYRYSNELIEKMKDIDWKNFKTSKFCNNEDLLYKKLNGELFEKIKKILEN